MISPVATQKHGQTSMPLVRFEPTIPVFERAKTARDHRDRPMKNSKDGVWKLSVLECTLDNFFRLYKLLLCGATAIVRVSV
jgi:hypothetical protein